DPIVRAGGALADTIATYLDCGRSLELAARTMFVHPNTVRYRLKKVGQLTGWDVLSTRDAHVLETAFALGRLRDSTHLPL
ncbi:MAG: helix-turn-helix domain-containing protein, partial [Demequina sp.]